MREKISLEHASESSGTKISMNGSTVHKLCEGEMDRSLILNRKVFHTFLVVLCCWFTTIPKDCLTYFQS